MADPIDELKQSHRETWRGAGGGPGGVGQFALGFALAAGGLYLLLDSVRVTAGGAGLFSGGMARWMGGEMGHAWTTTSMAILFVPFILGVIALFYDRKMKVGWVLLYVGLGLLVVEILSRIRFLFNVKTTHFLLMLALFGAGVGLMLRALRDEEERETERNV